MQRTGSLAGGAIEITVDEAINPQVTEQAGYENTGEEEWKTRENWGQTTIKQKTVV